MTVQIRDEVLLNDWHPVAESIKLSNKTMVAAILLDQAIVIWRDQIGKIQAFEDRCPHRGMKLSMGSITPDGNLECPYHGWQFNHQGSCEHIPALPHLCKTQLKGQLKSYQVQEAYGLVWVCLGLPAQGVVEFPEYADPQLRKIGCGPYEVQSSGPRIIENFLDMAHFAFVHESILGDKEQSAIRDYEVEVFQDEIYGSGIWAKKCFAWQPRSNALASSGSNVEYTYRVVRPLTAILTKEPLAQADFREAISLHLQPVTETITRAWIILAMNNFEQTDEELRAFQDTIFLQDKPIVENQVPLRLPLAPGAEMSTVCDKMSLAYRRYLKGKNLKYGIISLD